MKKIISLALCIVLLCFAFVGCKDDEIGEDLKNRVTDDGKNDKLEVLNFYIVTDGAVDNAKKTVTQSINAYLKDNYKVELNIVYCTAEEYYSESNESASKVLAAASASAEGDRADIVLINSKSLFDKLYSENLLLNLNRYYYDREYQSLRAIIEDNLLIASRVAEEKDNKQVSSYYTVPNNHKIGKYTYIVINKQKVVDTLHYSEPKIQALTTVESLAELKSAIEKYWTDENIPHEDRVMDDYVKVVSGKDYADRELLEYGVSSRTEITEQSKKVNIVNISAYPTATPEEAFSAAFAIVKNTNDKDNNDEGTQALLDAHYSKCMSIIYALSTDVQFRNLLQYGYVGLNYKFERDSEDTVQRIIGEDSTYLMNPAYTGNMYNCGDDKLLVYYCDEFGWNPEASDTMKKQNANSFTLQQKVDEELTLQDMPSGNHEVAESCTIDLITKGTKHGDVTFVWSSDSEYAVVNGGAISILLPQDEDAVATITRDIYVGDIKVVTEEYITIKILAPVEEA